MFHLLWLADASGCLQQSFHKGIYWAICFISGFFTSRIAAQSACRLYPPKADMGSAQVHVRFGPIADIESAARSTYGFLRNPAVC